MSATTPPTRKQRKPLVLLRPVPGDSVIHRMWAGTKLLAVAGIALMLAFYPGWVPIVFAAVLVLVAVRLARIPGGAVPSIPVWLWILLGLGALTATFAGGTPVLDVGSMQIGLGGLLKFLRVTLLALVLLGLGALVSWTTKVADIAPAIATLGRPLRVLRVPVHDWAVTIALALRAFPMLIDEFRTLYAARRLRPKKRAQTFRARHQQRVADAIDLVAAALTVALRRADEMGDAITARGGSGQFSAAPSRPKTRDWVTFAILVLVCGTSLALELTILGTSMPQR